MTHFYPGQLVECINDRPVSCSPPPPGCILVGGLDGLRRGNVYTVRNVCEYLGEECLRLEEIRREDTSEGEAAYHISRFRPVDDRKLDVFRAMLEPAHKRERVS